MATRYWVGGTGNWNNTARWSDTSGGSSGFSVPTSADDVIFDSNSHTTNYTVTINVPAVCRDMTWGNPSSGAPTLAGTDSLGIFGSLSLVSGMGRTYTGTITFSATSTGKTITMNSVALAGPVVFSGNGGGWTLQDAFNLGSTSAGTITLTQGSLDTNGQTVTCYSFTSSNTITRSLTLGASSINLASLFNISTPTNLTFNAGTSTITITRTANIGFCFGGGGQTFYKVIITTDTTNGTIYISGANTFTDLELYNTSYSLAFRNFIYLSASQTVSGNFKAIGYSNSSMLSVMSSDAFGSFVTNTQYTITCNGTTTLTNVNFRGIIGAGSASWAGGTNVGNIGNNSGITFDAAKNRYWVHGASASYGFLGGGRWATSSGGSVGASPPLPQDTAIFDANSFSASGKTVLNSGGVLPAIDFSAATNSPTLSFGSGNNFFSGDITLINSMTLSNAQSSYFFGGKNVTLDFANKTFCSNTSAVNYFFGGSFTITLARDADFGAKIYHASGTFATANYNVTAGRYNDNNTTDSVTPTLTPGSSTITLTEANYPTVTITRTTISSNTATLKFTANSTTNGGCFISTGKTIGTVWVDRQNTGTFAWTGGHTVGTLKVRAGQHIIMPSNYTMNVTTFDVDGTPGTLTKFRSENTTRAKFNKSGGDAKLNYVDIDYLECLQANEIYCDADSVDGGHNVFIYFADAVDITKGAEYVIGSGATPVSITKGAQYMVTTETDVTKGCTYAVKSPVDVTKGANYCVKTEIDNTLGAEYKVTATPEITKDLKYTVTTTPADIAITCEYKVLTTEDVTKGAIYMIAKNIPIDLDCEYEVNAPIGITKDLGYCVTSPVEQTLDCEYIVTSPTDITKGLGYTILNNVDNTLGAAYAIVTENEITKGAEYIVVSPSDIVKGLQYTVIAPQSIDLDCAYTVVTDTDITLGADYTVIEPYGLQKGLQYAIKRPRSIELDCAYFIGYEQSINKQTDYRIVTETEVNKTLAYTLFFERSVSKGLEYKINKTRKITRGAQYFIKSTHELDLGCEYIVERESEITKPLAYCIIKERATTLGAEYVLNQGSHIMLSARYYVKAEHAITLGAAYSLRIYPYSNAPSPYSPKTGIYTPKNKPYTPFPKN